MGDDLTRRVDSLEARMDRIELALTQVLASLSGAAGLLSVIPSTFGSDPEEQTAAHESGPGRSLPLRSA